MVKFLRLIIMAVILLGFNFKVHAELVVESNGRVRVSTGGFNQNGVRTWRYLDNGRGGMGGNMFYHENTSKSLAVRDASTGFRSASTVPVTIEAQVSRKAVLSGAFGLVKAGAKLGLKAAPYVGAASYAYDAYQFLKGDLEKEGYKWNEVSEEFLKEWPARNCIWDRDENDRLYDVACYGVDSSVLSAYRKGGKSRIEAEQLMRGQMEKLAFSYWEKHKKELDTYSGSKFWEFYSLDACYFDMNGGSCSVTYNGDGRSPISFRLKMRDTEVLSQDKFLQIATSSIDGYPTPFVKGTGYPEFNEKVSVPAGTVVTIGPVTPENGKPVQITITFGKDSSGNTTANVETTPRSDLIPGSPAAPKPNPTPDDNPKDNPKPDPDDSPSGKNKPKPDDKSDPDGKEDPKKDERPKEDEKPKESGGLLCEVFPNILACAEKGDVEEQEEPFKIPHTQNETTFSPDFFLPDNGVCPAPRTATYLGITMEFKYDLICRFAEMIRFLVIGIAAVVAAFIMFSSRKD